MDKHSEKFKSLNISLDTFLRLNDADLIAAGITDENDRKIILQNLSIHRKSSEEYLVLEK